MRFKNIFNLLNTLFSTLKRFLGNREVLANFKEIENRLQTCRLCKFKIGDTLKNMKCKKCECMVRYKVRLAESYCPEGKWDATDS